MQLTLRLLIAALFACGNPASAQVDSSSAPVIPLSKWPAVSGPLGPTVLGDEDAPPYDCTFDTTSDCRILVLAYPPRTPQFSKSPFDANLCTAQVTVAKIAIARERFNTAPAPHTVTWYLQKANGAADTIDYQFDTTKGIDLHSSHPSITPKHHADPEDLHNYSVGGGGKEFSWQAINLRKRPVFPWLCAQVWKVNCDVRYLATVSGDGIACQRADPIIVLGGP